MMDITTEVIVNMKVMDIVSEFTRTDDSTAKMQKIIIIAHDKFSNYTVGTMHSTRNSTVTFKKN